MSDIVIQIDQIGKKYQIGENYFYRSLRETITQKFSRKNSQLNDSSYWALRDISLTIHRGDIVGLLGNNGSGKSTLFKILSQITPPTTGKAHILGRIGSLLEAGTGFHPELTGRENIFLAGSILGMKKKEIIKKFDEIVEFSEVQPFIDTPVKKYSTGMNMRLAFSVAVHLDTEILLIDEVLAVGDQSFQQKCLNKLSSCAKEGRTILFVSHNIKSIEDLCTHCVLLNQGRLRRFGATKEVLHDYLIP